MKKIYCVSCGKTIRLREILMQSVMFGVYCERCGEVSKASKKSKIIFSAIFVIILLINIVVPMLWWLKILLALLWCVIGLWILQPIICEFE